MGWLNGLTTGTGVSPSCCRLQPICSPAYVLQCRMLAKSGYFVLPNEPTSQVGQAGRGAKNQEVFAVCCRLQHAPHATK